MAEEFISGEQHQAGHQSGSRGHKVTIPLHSAGLVIAVIILCGLSFWGGASYQKHHTKSTPTAGTTPNFSGGGAGGFGGARRSGGFGQVTAVSSSSITVTNPRSGTGMTYTITGSTTISDNGQAVTVSDIQTGETVLITTSGSGSTTATSIMVNPSFGGQGSSGTSGQSN